MTAKHNISYMAKMAGDYETLASLFYGIANPKRAQVNRLVCLAEDEGLRNHYVRDGWLVITNDYGHIVSRSRVLHSGGLFTFQHGSGEICWMPNSVGTVSLPFAIFSGGELVDRFATFKDALASQYLK